MAIEDVVAERESDRVPADELAADEKRLGQAVRARLHGVIDVDAEMLAVAEQPAERLLVLRCRDEENLADAGKHQRRERVVDHRLVVDRHELLGHCDGEGIQPGPGTAGEDDAFQDLSTIAAGRSRAEQGRTMGRYIEKSPGWPGLFSV